MKSKVSVIFQSQEKPSHIPTIGRNDGFCAIFAPDDQHLLEIEFRKTRKYVGEFKLELPFLRKGSFYSCPTGKLKNGTLIEVQWSEKQGRFSKTYVYENKQFFERL